MKSIVFVTGTRADFGKITPLIQVAKSKFEVTVFATGIHMLQKYGRTVDEVRSLGVEVIEFLNQREGDGQDVILAKTTSAFSDFLREVKPDLVIVHGDRVEAFACAIAATLNGVLCAHIEGGEVSGTIDETFRHCISKICQVHFVSSPDAKMRLIQMGENPEKVFPIGSPELEIHKKIDSEITIDEVRKYYEIPFMDFGILVFHPVTSELGSLQGQVDSLFEAAEQSMKQFVVILPNNDPGSDLIFEKIDMLPTERFRIIPSMRFQYFSILLRNCSLIIGNSSAGVREAPFLGVASINVGTRQNNRARSQNVKNYRTYNISLLKEAISQTWGNRMSPSMSYGDGNSSEVFLRVLSTESFWGTPFQKCFHDFEPIVSSNNLSIKASQLSY